MMDRAKFYAALRKSDSGVFGKSLSQKQVSGIEAVLDEAAKRKTPIRWLAYMLATDYHETARTMQPIEEYGKGKGRKYGKPGKYGQSQHGRGLVQLTWDFNYEKADEKLRLRGALLQNFNLALDMKIAVEVMFTGMEEGWFTGKKLADFLDYKSMRRIINGMDKAALIAGCANAFEIALRGAGYGVDLVGVKPVPVLGPEHDSPGPIVTPPKQSTVKPLVVGGVGAAIVVAFWQFSCSMPAWLIDTLGYGLKCAN